MKVTVTFEVDEVRYAEARSLASCAAVLRDVEVRARRFARDQRLGAAFAVAKVAGR